MTVDNWPRAAIDDEAVFEEPELTAKKRAFDWDVVRVLMLTGLPRNRSYRGSNSNPDTRHWCQLPKGAQLRYFLVLASR